MKTSKRNKMDAKQNRATIIGKMREHQAIIDTGSITVVEANDMTAEWGKALESEDTNALQRINERMPADAFPISNAARSIEILKETLDMDLTHVPTRYVISDEDLISPGGFHPESKVYVKNNVFIMADILPSAISGNLKVYEV